MASTTSPFQPQGYMPPGQYSFPQGNAPYGQSIDLSTLQPPSFDTKLMDKFSTYQCSKAFKFIVIVWLLIATVCIICSFVYKWEGFGNNSAIALLLTSLIMAIYFV